MQINEIFIIKIQVYNEICVSIPDSFILTNYKKMQVFFIYFHLFDNPLKNISIHLIIDINKRFSTLTEVT